MDMTKLKKLAAEKAVEQVESGMIVGLGEGSTAIFALIKIGELLQDGTLKNIRGIPCSKKIADAATQARIPLTTLEAHPVIDLTIDGADEIDPALNLIKGGGGALFREKIVAQASKREIIVADESKLSPALGTIFALPIEVLPFGWESQKNFLTELGAKVKQRSFKNGTPYFTDQGNYILDADFGPIHDLNTLNGALNQRVGIVEHGLFLDLASQAIIAGKDGVITLNS